MMEQSDKKVVVTFPTWNPGWVEPEVLRARVLDLLRVYRKMNLGVSPITGSFGWRREDGAVEVAFSAHSPLEGALTLPEELCLGLAGHAVFWRNQVREGKSFPTEAEPKVLCVTSLFALAEDNRGVLGMTCEEFERRLKSIPVVDATEVGDQPVNARVSAWMEAKRELTIRSLDGFTFS
ncbi:hypothetical protein CEP51_016832 [Fusarium floridanum]|uniref:Uncharacterized protein n=1 Tax=Fusarium floridanum TaxID=1325733 RepID=A0A428NEN6_9HYPO|nr:hypothetical protein CEP51_016832 [Fusarium floridanum]